MDRRHFLTKAAAMTTWAALSWPLDARAQGKGGQKGKGAAKGKGGAPAARPSGTPGEHPRGGAKLSREQSIAAWKTRIGEILGRGKLPIIDTQATYVAGMTNVPKMLDNMKRLDVAQIAFAAANAPNSEPSLDLHRKFPQFFVPTTNSGEFPRWWNGPQQFLSGVAADLQSGSYFMMGEHEFRHLPSPEQVADGRKDRDITIDLAGPAGQALFQLSEKSGVAFQIHYEIEDRLLPALEAMLARYPKAKAIWCHLAMIRNPDRAKNYGPALVASLIERFPGLHFDLAVPAAGHVYAPSGARDATIYAPSGEIKAEWRAVLEKYPDRFLAASDYRPPIEDHYAANILRQRKLLGELSPATQRHIAFGNAWRLITGENWVS
jgi:hypothetical protein